MARICSKNKDIKVIVFDTIVFKPDIYMSFKALIAVYCKLNILSCVNIPIILVKSLLIY